MVVDPMMRAQVVDVVEARILLGAKMEVQKENVKQAKARSDIYEKVHLKVMLFEAGYHFFWGTDGERRRVRHR